MVGLRKRAEVRGKGEGEGWAACCWAAAGRRGRAGPRWSGASGPRGEKKGAGQAGLGEGLGWVSSFLFLFLLFF